MPAAVPVPIRRAMFRRWQQGTTAAELSRSFGIAPRTVRGLLRRWRQRGEDGLAPDPPRPPDRAPTHDHPAFGPALLLRRQHPRWGAGLIRVYLAKQGLAPLPGVRTLQRWFRRAGLAPAPAGRRPDSEGRRAAAPHEIWQVDAAEEIHLGGGGSACWLRVVDEFTGAVLHTAVFPPRALEFGPGRGHAGATAGGLPPLGPAPGPPRR
jgi:transposase